MNYNFSQLNDKEFEILVTDLLSNEFEIRIERFKPGKDLGIDGRFFIYDSQEVIIQCKHYLKTGYKGLISKLKNEESKKVKKIKPKKYIFVTSVQLSKDNKEEVKSIFKPFIKRSDDVYGQEDLNDLLFKNPKVEERHFKLWISSTTVFNRIINNAIKGRSEFELEQIKNKSNKYIQTENHDTAIKILNEKHILLISGEPGIGKTTLAENLCLFYASKDYEFIDIEESLSEAENIYARGKKQIFYFDDFLGSNYFEAIENKKDSHIVKFIERIQNDKTKRFILTSRTNILNSGILHSCALANFKIRKNEFMLSIDKLTRFDRARILYNHIWFSELPEDYIDELYKEKRYKEIIKHSNYNPRLMEFITDIDRLNIFEASDYWNYILNTLNNPKDIWNDCFKIQNNAYVRNIVKLTVFNGGNISEDELSRSSSILNEFEKLNNPSHTEKDFKSITRLATKSFLNRNKFPAENYTLFNPSIADFVISEYSTEIINLVNVFKSLNTVKSLTQLLSLESEKIISSEDCLNIKNILFEDAFEQGKRIDYLVYISDQFKDDKNKKRKIIRFIKKFVKNPSPITEFSRFLGLLVNYFEASSFEDFDFILVCINDRTLDKTEIDDFADFLDFWDINDESLFDKLKQYLEYFLSEELNSRVDEIDLSNYITITEGYDGEQDYDYSVYDIEKELRDLLKSLLNEFYSDLIRKLDVNFQEIINTIDIDEMVSDFIASQEDENIEGYRGTADSFDQDIDDLFERS
jgi:SpoVK/Ycf46/Vps4 family AAA+-type ATPase